uniref:Uncharacterized protein n=1 Tax=Cajanus cajan TaxID=3821 RepID=A0A151U9U2_CAJCA|nr:hypothetical protein KK1_020180 [Cajanus cajan]KYP75972.1 hypothetical protein KK1_020186 [Cajanus cajan]KYP75981.1 hypothetical protein KK1_020199 [Cajanus cajan]
MLSIWGHGVCWHYPPKAPQQIRDLELIKVGVVFQCESHQRHTILFRHNVKPPCFLESLFQHYHVVSTIFHHVSISLQSHLMKINLNTSSSSYNKHYESVGWSYYLIAKAN